MITIFWLSLSLSRSRMLNDSTPNVQFTMSFLNIISLFSSFGPLFASHAKILYVIVPMILFSPLKKMYLFFFLAGKHAYVRGGMKNR